MALFTDGPLNGLQDLQHYENSILEVAGIEGIDLGAKLNLAQAELESQLMLFILRHPLRDMKATIRRSIGLRDVVVTSSLKQWHALATLAAIYRDAYNNQLNDRYLGKWNEYQRLGHIASTDYLQLGVGIVADPIVKAASPILTAAAGAGAGGQLFRRGVLDQQRRADGRAERRSGRHNGSRDAARSCGDESSLECV